VRVSRQGRDTVSLAKAKQAKACTTCRGWKAEARRPQDVFCTTSRTILPKGGVPPPVGYPLRGADRHRASPHHCNVWPLHHQPPCIGLRQYREVGLAFLLPRAPMINLVAVELRPGRLPRSPDPIAQPSRGLDARYRRGDLSPRLCWCRMPRLMAGEPSPRGCAGHWQAFAAPPFSWQRGTGRSRKLWLLRGIPRAAWS